MVEGLSGKFEDDDAGPFLPRTKDIDFEEDDDDEEDEDGLGLDWIAQVQKEKSFLRASELLS